MKALKKYFSTVQLKILSGMIVTPIIVFGGLIVWDIIRNEPAPNYYVEYLGAIAALCIAISSALIIKYKEVPRPGLPSIKGTWAVIQGVFALLIFGFLSIFLFYEATVCLLK